MKYVTRDREAGNIIDQFNALEEAEAAIRQYEAEDKDNGCFEENFYEVAAFDADGNEVEL